MVSTVREGCDFKLVYIYYNPNQFGLLTWRVRKAKLFACKEQLLMWFME